MLTPHENRKISSELSKLNRKMQAANGAYAPGGIMPFSGVAPGSFLGSLTGSGAYPTSAPYSAYNAYPAYSGYNNYQGSYGMGSCPAPMQALGSQYYGNNGAGNWGHNWHNNWRNNLAYQNRYNNRYGQGFFHNGNYANRPIWQRGLGSMGNTAWHGSLGGGQALARAAAWGHNLAGHGNFTPSNFMHGNFSHGNFSHGSFGGNGGGWHHHTT
jgi:hypothetical protein